jgi:hypothetical protein
VAKAKEANLIPPEIHNANLPAPYRLETVRDIREEMSRIYKMVFKGKIMLSDATRLAYYLDKMIQAIKTETEMNAIAAAYAKAWGGINIITDNEEVIDV